jgi:hypothetical protein
MSLTPASVAIAENTSYSDFSISSHASAHARREAQVLGGSVAYRYSPRLDTIYLNITNHCSNGCCFCVRNSSSGLSGYRLCLDREPTGDEIWAAFKPQARERYEGDGCSPADVRRVKYSLQLVRGWGPLLLILRRSASRF